MSSPDLTTSYPATFPNFFLATPSDGETETNFAQTKEPFDITSCSELDDSEDNVEIETTKNNLSHPTDNNSQSQFRISETAESFASHHTSTSSEFSDPTTDDLIQYASDIALFAVNHDSSQERCVITPNREIEDLARLRVVITRKPVGFGVLRDRGSLAGTSLKIEDLPGFVISPVVEQDGFDPMGRYGPIQRGRTDDAFRLPALPQHHNNASIMGTLSPSAIGPRAPLAEIGLHVGGLPKWAISPVVEQDGYKFAHEFQPFDGFQSVDEYQNVNAFQPQSLTSPQEHTQTSSLGNISETPLISKSSPLNLLNQALYKNYLKIIHGEKPKWNISSSAAEELFRPSLDEEPSPMEEEECNNNTLIPPPTPILGNLSTPPDLSEMDLDSQDGVRSLFQILPRRGKKSKSSSLKSSTREETNERFIVGTGEVCENSKSLNIQSVVEPPSLITLRERLEPRMFRFSSYSLDASSHHPLEITQRINANTNSHIDVWPTIALALGIPILPSHLLTSASLQALATFSKLIELEEGYLSDGLHQWALKQYRIFIWINSDALEDGIDGIVEEPVIVPQGQGLNEDSDGGDSDDSKLWDYEDVEAFARSEIVLFRRSLEWIQGVDVDVEGEEGTVCTSPDEVYNFCGNEEIIHRSASEPVEESEGLSAVLEEYYEMKRNAGGQSKISSSSNQSLIHGIRKSVIFWASENYW